MSHYYVIEKPFINGNGEADIGVLSHHLQDKESTRFVAWFENFNWSEIQLETLDQCIDAILNYIYPGIVKENLKSKVYLYPTEFGYDICKLKHTTTLDNSQRYQGSEYLATIISRGE